VDLRGLDQGGAFEIDTPNAVVTLLDAGKYRVDVRSNGETSVTVREGDAEVTAGGYARDLPAGQSTVISGSYSITYSGTANGPPDAWDSWCADRDRLLDRASPSAYVSQDMIGAEDLDANGTWSVQAGYGPSWAPSHVPANWAPYRFGHWAWVEPWGWTWIDEAPWGFAPFHYGRWAYLNARWLWIPGAVSARPVYAPALVVFVGGSGWTQAGGQGIGWFPLGPREIYVPPYQASVEYTQRINVTQVTVINVQIIQNYDVNKTVYMNRDSPRDMTVVPREDFAQSRSAGTSVISMPRAELARAPMMGMTAKIAPSRESVIARPSAAKTPAPQPPSALQSRPVFSRIAPQSVKVPFAQQQKDLAADPGRPVDPAALAKMRQAQRPPAPLVTIVKPVPIAARPAPAPARPSAPAARPIAPAPAPARPSAPAARPIAPAPAPAARPIAPAARPIAPAPVPAPASQSSSKAAALIATLKGRTLPDADRSLSEARKVAGIRLDFNAAAGRIAAARQVLAGAERDMAAKKFDQAFQEAESVQGQIGDLMNQISAAMQAAKQAPRQAPGPAPAQAPGQASDRGGARR